MKKIFSLVLTAFILLGLLNLTPTLAYADEKTLEEYSAQLCELNKSYGVDSIGGTDTNTDSSKIQLNRIIVKTDNNNPLTEDFGAIAKVEGYDGLHILQYTNQQVTEQAYEYYSNLPNIAFVEFDFLFQALEPELEQTEEYNKYESNKDYLSWGSATVEADKAVSYANSLAEKAPEIIVAVIDTGIDADHSFFEGRIVDSNVDLIENDGNPDDDNLHGTFVSGVIADNTSKNVKLSAYKTINNVGQGYYTTTCIAIDLAVKNNVNIINMSLSWKKSESCYNMFEKSLQNASDNNIPVIVSAGNQSDDASNRCPASNNNVITVAATKINNMPADFSNYGECVDIAAPGVSIKSTMPDNSYDDNDGTSFAAPFVAAAAAFIKTINPECTPEIVKSIIRESAFVPKNWNALYGTGILNFSNIMSKLSASTPELSFNKNNNVVISSPYENAIIYYTTDGSNPIIGVSNIYTKPINTSNLESIKAIATENQKIPSAVATLKIKWEEDIDIRYKGTKRIKSPYDISKVHSSNEEIVSFDGKKIKGESVGRAKVTICFETGQIVTYDVRVDFAPFQWFHKIIYKLFGVLLWSL